MFNAADVQWVDHCKRHKSRFDITFMQQLCNNILGEIIAALNEEMMLQLASTTFFQETIMLKSNIKQNQYPAINTTYV